MTNEDERGTVFRPLGLDKITRRGSQGLPPSHYPAHPRRPVFFNLFTHTARCAPLYKLSLAAFAAAALIAPGAAEAGKTWGKHAHTYGETPKTTTGDDSTAVASDEPLANDKPLAEVLAADGDFSTLLAAVAVAKDDASAVIDDLAGEGPFTVFAPTDDAFKARRVVVVHVQ